MKISISINNRNGDVKSYPNPKDPTQIVIRKILTLGAVSSTFGLFSISHNPSLKPFLLLGFAYFSLFGRYGKISFGPRKALYGQKDFQ